MATVSGHVLSGDMGLRIPLKVWWWPFVFYAKSNEIASAYNARFSKDVQ